MAWLEIIKVQGAAMGFQDADSELLNQLDQASGGAERVRVYVNAAVADDLVITLAWDSAPPRPGGSDLALSLAREFKRHGLVDHSVWIER